MTAQRAAEGEQAMSVADELESLDGGWLSRCAAAGPRGTATHPTRQQRRLDAAAWTVRSRLYQAGWSGPAACFEQQHDWRQSPPLRAQVLPSGAAPPHSAVQQAQQRWGGPALPCSRPARSAWSSCARLF